MSDPSTKDTLEQLRTANPSRIPLAEQVRHEWSIMVPPGTTIKDVLRPGFWTHHSPRLSPWDKIEVRTEDGTWYAELLVMATDRSWARVHKLAYHSLTTADVSQSQASEEEIGLALEGLKVVHRGRDYKWSVVRREDNAVLREKLTTKHDAEAQALEIARAETAHASLEAEG